jgi:predicted ATPase
MRLLHPLQPRRDKTPTEGADIATLDDVCDRFGAFVVLGAPGSGKTSCLEYLATRFAVAAKDMGKKHRIPLLVSLSEIQKGTVFPDFLAEQLERVAIEQVGRIRSRGVSSRWS